jgi:hypothetical protein
MDAEMYDDDDGDEMMDQNHNNQQQGDKKDKPRGNRLSDQLNMEDEPALVGYERYVAIEKQRCPCFCIEGVFCLLDSTRLPLSSHLRCCLFDLLVGLK